MTGEAVVFLLAIALDTAYSRIQIYHRRTLNSESTLQEVDTVAVLNQFGDTSTYHEFECIDTTGLAHQLNWRRIRRPERHVVSLVQNVQIGTDFMTVLRLDLGEPQSIFLSDTGVHICENTETSESIEITIYQGSAALRRKKFSNNFHFGSTAILQVYSAIAPSVASTTEIQWLTPSNRLSTNLDDSNNALVILNVGTSDIGRYRISILQSGTVLNRTEMELNIFDNYDVISRPEFLFEAGTYTHPVIIGSDVVLFCEVDWFHKSLSITWKKNDSPLVQNLPHVVIRNSATSSSVMSILVIYDFKNSDSGYYHCSAQDLLSSLDGKRASLRAVTGLQQVLAVDIINGRHSRLSVNVGETATFGYRINLFSSSRPNIMCYRNGKISRRFLATYVASNIFHCKLEFVFKPGDEGIYQCIFTRDSEVLMAPPILLGNSALSPNFWIRSNSRQVLHFMGLSSEKLTLEVATSGSGYVNWFKNGVIIDSPDSAFLFFGEIYHLHNIEVEPYGRYEARLTPSLNKFHHHREYLAHFLATASVAPDTFLYNTPPINILEEGTDLILSCASSGEPLPSITWKFNGSVNIQAPITQRIREPSISSQTQQVTHRTRIVSLHLDSVFFPRDHGLYECTGQANSLTSSATNVTLAIKVLEVKVTADPPSVGFGYSVTLTCVVTKASPPVLTYRWTKLSTSTILPYNSPVLTTEVNSLEDLEYSCEASNYFFVKTITFKLPLVTRVPPRVEIKRYPPGLSAIEIGSSVILDCEPQEGDLPFSYMWFGTHKEKLSFSRELRITFNSFTQYGLYICLATNIFGTSTANFLAETPAKPIVRISSLPDVFIAESATLTAQVLINFRVTLTITWYFNNKPLDDNNERYNISVSDSGTKLERVSVFYANLSIPDVTFNDGGVYTVVAANEFGADNKTFTVEILARPNFSIPLIKNSIMETSLHKSVVLVCNATGIPAPIITWSFEPDSRIHISTMTGKSGNFLFTSSYLSIFGVQKDDSGDYVCTATTRFASGNASESKVYSLFVKFASVIVSGPTSRKSCFDFISLTCLAQGYPLPEVTWDLVFTNGFQIGGVSHRNIYNFSGNVFTVSTNQMPLMNVGSTLESKFIKHAICMNFSATLCHATNSLGKDSIAEEEIEQDLRELVPDTMAVVIGALITFSIIAVLFSSLSALVCYVNRKKRSKFKVPPSSLSSPLDSLYEDYDSVRSSFWPEHKPSC